MKSARATLDLNADDTRHYRLPHDGTPSLLYVFDGQQLGARAYSASGQDFAPGTSQQDVRLEFWADEPWTNVVVPGAEFVIWYGGDVGRGRIESVG